MNQYKHILDYLQANRESLTETAKNCLDNHSEEIISQLELFCNDSREGCKAGDSITIKPELSPDEQPEPEKWFAFEIYINDKPTRYCLYLCDSIEID